MFISKNCSGHYSEVLHICQDTEFFLSSLVLIFEKLLAVLADVLKGAIGLPGENVRLHLAASTHNQMSAIRKRSDHQIFWHPDFAKSTHRCLMLAECLLNYNLLITDPQYFECCVFATSDEKFTLFKPHHLQDFAPVDAGQQVILSFRILLVI